MSRLQELMAAVESGEPITPDYLARMNTLIALDCAIAAEVFVEEHLTRQSEADAELAAELNQ